VGDPACAGTGEPRRADELEPVDWSENDDSRRHTFSCSLIEVLQAYPPETPVFLKDMNFGAQMNGNAGDFVLEGEYVLVQSSTTGTIATRKSNAFASLISSLSSSSHRDPRARSRPADLHSFSSRRPRAKGATSPGSSSAIREFLLLEATRPGPLGPIRRRELCAPRRSRRRYGRWRKRLLNFHWRLQE